MAKARRRKTDHVLFAEVTKSRSKAGVWFDEEARFKKAQKEAMARVLDRIDWVKLPNAVLAISQEPVGIVVLAPNPSLPGVIVLADGTSKANTQRLQAKYTKVVEDCLNEVGVKVTATK